MNMIEEIKTPISTPMSGTPLPSPMIERSSMVRASRHLKISARFAQQSKATFVSGNHGPPVSLPGPTFPHCDFTLPAAQTPDVAPLPPRGWAYPQTHAVACHFSPCPAPTAVHTEMTLTVWPVTQQAGWSWLDRKGQNLNRQQNVSNRGFWKLSGRGKWITYYKEKRIPLKPDFFLEN